MEHFIGQAQIIVFLKFPTSHLLNFTRSQVQKIALYPMRQELLKILSNRRVRRKRRVIIYLKFPTSQLLKFTSSINVPHSLCSMPYAIYFI